MKYECNCYRPEPHKCTHETEGRAPERCCISGETDADWKPVTEIRKPKLTVEELKKRGIEWPANAKYAAVNIQGTGVWYTEKPTLFKENGCWKIDGTIDTWSKGAGEARIGHIGDWDTDGWQTSLIPRPVESSCSAEHEDFPAAETPDETGAKAGDWLRHALGGIVRVGKPIPGGFIDVEGRIFKYVYPHSFTPVTFRKWTPEEWRKQVGKAFYMKTDAYLLTSYNASWKNTLVFSELGRMSEDLATTTFTQFNGMPCGVPQVDGKDVLI